MAVCAFIFEAYSNLLAMGYYRKARNYELLICKVYNCEKGKKYGADESFFMQLFLNDIQKEGARSHVSTERQFFKVQMYIQKALIVLRKRKKYIDSDKHFMPLLLRLQKATCVNDLSAIVNTSIAKMITLENTLKRAS